MKCPVCGYDVPEGKKYCPLCGNSMEMEPGEELMFRNTSEPEKTFDPKADDTQFSWDTFDFKKPKDFRDITMDWSQADFSEAVERAAKSMEARAAERHAQPAPAEGTAQPASAEGTAQPAPAEGAAQPASEEIHEQPAPEEIPVQPAPEETPAKHAPADIPAQPAPEEGPRLIIPDFSEPDFSDGWIELVKQPSEKEKAPESPASVEDDIKVSADEKDDDSESPVDTSGLVWKVPELFKDSAPLAEGGVPDEPAREDAGSADRDADMRIASGEQSERLRGLDALLRKSTREFDFAPESFDLDDTRIYEHSAARWNSSDDESERELPQLDLFGLSEGDETVRPAETAASEVSDAKAGSDAAAEKAAEAGSAETLPEDEPVSYDWLKTQVSPIRRGFFTEDLDLNYSGEKSPEQFFTFNRKNEEFQKLLDEEYARIMSVRAEADSIKMPPSRVYEDEEPAAEISEDHAGSQGRAEAAAAGATAHAEDKEVEAVEELIEPRPELGAPSVSMGIGSDTEEIGRKLDALFGEVVRKEAPAKKDAEASAVERGSAYRPAPVEMPDTDAAPQGTPDADPARTEAPDIDTAPAETPGEETASAETPSFDVRQTEAASAETPSFDVRQPEAAPAETPSFDARQPEAAPAEMPGEETAPAETHDNDTAPAEILNTETAPETAAPIHEFFDWRTSSEIAADEASAAAQSGISTAHIGAHSRDAAAPIAESSRDVAAAHIAAPSQDAAEANKELSSLEERLERLQKELEARRNTVAPEGSEEETVRPEIAAGSFSYEPEKAPAPGEGFVSRGIPESDFDDLSSAISAGHPQESPAEDVPSEGTAGSTPREEHPADEPSVFDIFPETAAAEGRPAAEKASAADHGAENDRGSAAGSGDDATAEAADSEQPRGLYDTKRLSSEEQAEIESSISELFDSREEAPGPKRMHPFLGLLLTVAILAGIFEGGVFAMNSFAPDLPATETITQLDRAIKHAISDTLGGLGDKLGGLFGSKDEGPAVDADGVDFKAIVSEYNKNIKSVSRNSELAYGEGVKTSIKDLESCPVVDDAAVKTEIYKTMISYNSSWIDYVNGNDDSCFSYLKADGAAYRGAANFDRSSIDKETFNSFELGEIRSREGGAYIFTRENLSVNKGGQSSSAVYDWVYNLEKVGDEYKIVDYVPFS